MIKAENGEVRFEGTTVEIYVNMIEILRCMNLFLDKQDEEVIKLASTDVEFLEPLANLAKKVL